MELPDNLLAELEILENITSCNKVESQFKVQFQNTQCNNNSSKVQLQKNLLISVIKLLWNIENQPLIRWRTI